MPAQTSSPKSSSSEDDDDRSSPERFGLFPLAFQVSPIPMSCVLSHGSQPVSRINLARINVQLPTPHISPIFKHRLPIRPWVSIFDPNDHHPNSLRHIAFNHHVRPRCP